MHLFEPIALRDVVVNNRAWVAPMCQFSVEARDGAPTDWHLVHLGSRAVGGFGLVMTEATAVTPEGRITPQDVGLWNDRQVAAWRSITGFVHTQDARIGVQLAHAGRKASTFRPWEANDRRTVGEQDGGWQTVAPADVAFPGLAVPRGLDRPGIAEVVAQFAAAAARAEAAGFDLIELHAAHGYLLHQFLSPLANLRSDEYGGDFAGRTRIVFEVVDAVRAVWPVHKPLFIRLSATDWLPGGWDIAQTSELARRLKGHGVDLFDISSGGLLPTEDVSIDPGYQTGFAREVRACGGVPTAAAGLITDPEQAEGHLIEGDADAIMFGRAALREPYWALKAAQRLRYSNWRTNLPVQYEPATTVADD